MAESVRLDGSHFELPEYLFEDVETWVHEFTERSLFGPIEDELYLIPLTRGFAVSLDGVSTHCSIYHALTSLHVKSMVQDRLIGPDEFFKIIQSSTPTAKVVK